MVGNEPPPPERRKTGGRGDPLVSLSHLLESARRLACAEAIALADDSGVLIAGAGPYPDCEVLAAFAPFAGIRPLPANDVVPTRIDVLGATIVRRIRVDGVEVLLSARGGDPERAEALSRAAEGVQRILGRKRPSLLL